MGSIIQTNPIEYLFNVQISQLLSLYKFVCSTDEEYLGLMKIYRKQEFNFDYVAVLDKIVQQEHVGDIVKMVNINRVNLANQCVKYSQKQLIINNNYSKWLRVHGCEVYKIDELGTSFKHVKICIEYLNFTLKDYLLKLPPSALSSANIFPQPILYILSSIIDSYTVLVSHTYSPIILSLIKSITTLNLIYINPEGYLKFVDLPLFNLEDYRREVKQQCFRTCCSDQIQIQKQRYGVNKGFTVNNQRSKNFIQGGQQLGSQKLRSEKLFLSRFKKIVRFIKKQVYQQLEKSKNDLNQSECIETSRSKNINLIGNYKAEVLSKQEHPLWLMIQNCNKVDSLIKIFKQIPNIPRFLQFNKSKIGEQSKQTRKTTTSSTLQSFPTSQLFRETKITQQNNKKFQLYSNGHAAYKNQINLSYKK